jgi:hypothetical protein
MGIAAKPIVGIYFKDITIERAAKEFEIANTHQIELQNVRINGRLVNRPERFEK